MLDKQLQSNISNRKTIEISTQALVT